MRKTTLQMLEDIRVRNPKDYALLVAWIDAAYDLYVKDIPKPPLKKPPLDPRWH